MNVPSVHCRVTNYTLYLFWQSLWPQYGSYTIKPFAKTESEIEVLIFNSCQSWIPEENTAPLCTLRLKSEPLKCTWDEASAAGGTAPVLPQNSGKWLQLCCDHRALAPLSCLHQWVFLASVCLLLMMISAAWAGNPEMSLCQAELWHQPWVLPAGSSQGQRLQGSRAQDLAPSRSTAPEDHGVSFTALKDLKFLTPGEEWGKGK